jgi:hypothetical protein
VLCLLKAQTSTATNAPDVPRVSRPLGRTFVRLPRGHEAAEALRRSATQVHVRRDAIEAIVDDHGADLIDGGFVAPMLT